MANVKFEYLFLDIEWNQAPKTTDIEEREPVQIGIVAADANLKMCIRDRDLTALHMRKQKRVYRFTAKTQ